MSIVTVQENVKFQCVCGHIEELEPSEFDFEVVEKNERQMGSEVCNFAEIERDCSNCKKIFSVKIDVWEYPVGMLNHVEVTPDGGQVLNKNFSQNITVQIDR